MPYITENYLNIQRPGPQLKIFECSSDIETSKLMLIVAMPRYNLTKKHTIISTDFLNTSVSEDKTIEDDL